MPITVEHGGQAGTTAAQIIANAVQQQANRQLQADNLVQQLAAQHQMQREQIDARADLQRQAADDAMAHTALRFGLDEQIRKQEFDRTLAKKQEDARLQAENWEYQYSAQQRQEIARYNNARQMIQSSDQWSDSEKAAALQMIDLQQANIKPSMMPRDPSKPIYPEGQGIGQVWKDDNGFTVSRKANGELWQLDENKTIAGKRELARQAHEAKTLDLRDKQQQTLLNAYIGLMTKPIEYEAKDAEGNNYPAKRFRNPDEAMAVLQGFMGGGAQQVVVRNDDDYAALASGTVFTGPDGKRYKKP